MDMGHLPYSATLEPLGLPPREGLLVLRRLGYPQVQLSATHQGVRPRDLDRSARRDVLATLRRLELACSGIDCWIPPAHFTDAATVDRAVSTLLAAVELAHDLGAPVVATMLPSSGRQESICDVIAERAGYFGVRVADFAERVRDGATVSGLALGIDPPALIGRGVDPASFAVEHSSRIVAARLADLSTAGLRAPIGEADGQLDVPAYLAAVSLCEQVRAMVVDARQWRDVTNGLAAMAPTVV